MYGTSTGIPLTSQREETGQKRRLIGKKGKGFTLIPFVSQIASGLAGEQKSVMSRNPSPHKSKAQRSPEGNIRVQKYRGDLYTAVNGHR